MRAMIVAITDIQFHRLSIKPVTSTDITKRLMITTAFIEEFLDFVIPVDGELYMRALFD